MAPELWLADFAPRGIRGARFTAASRQSLELTIACALGHQACRLGGLVRA